MSSKKDRKKAETLLVALEDAGVTVTWLAGKTGYSRGYVSNVLHGKVAWTEEFGRRATEALKATAIISVTYRGRVIAMPENIYREAASLPTELVYSSFEQAWKQSWVAEHGAEALAVQAERAWAEAASPR